MRRFLLFALVLTIHLLPVVSAQPSFGAIEDRQTNVTAYYFHVLPGEATIRVNIWGSVRAPGVYEVGEATTLGELVSFAGGPQLQVLRDNARREIDVTLYRREGDARVLAYAASLGDMVEGDGAYMLLQDGDVAEIELREIRGFSWRDAFTIVSATAAVALAVERIASTF